MGFFCCRNFPRSLAIFNNNNKLSSLAPASGAKIASARTLLTALKPTLIQEPEIVSISIYIKVNLQKLL